MYVENCEMAANDVRYADVVVSLSTDREEGDLVLHVLKSRRGSPHNIRIPFEHIEFAPEEREGDASVPEEPEEHDAVLLLRELVDIVSSGAPLTWLNTQNDLATANWERRIHDFLRKHEL